MEERDVTNRFYTASQVRHPRGPQCYGEALSVCNLGTGLSRRVPVIPRHATYTTSQARHPGDPRSGKTPSVCKLGTGGFRVGRSPDTPRKYAEFYAMSRSAPGVFAPWAIDPSKKYLGQRRSAVALGENQQSWVTQGDILRVIVN